MDIVSENLIWFWGGFFFGKIPLEDTKKPARLKKHFDIYIFKVYSFFFKLKNHFNVFDIIFRKRALFLFKNDIIILIYSLKKPQRNIPHLISH